jgi:PAS domain S-box-containing protein
VGRPLYREGRFAGAVYFLVSSERMAQKLGRLALADDDIVALLKHDGQFLARSLNNEGAMGQSLPASRPFLQKGAVDVGSYREPGLVDRVPRVFGWHRVSKTGTVLVVGLAESSVLAPLAPAMKRSMWVAGALSSLLLTGGLVVAWLLWRDGRTAHAMYESEWHLKAAQRMAKVAHMTHDLRTGATVWSDEVYRIFGYERDDPSVIVSGSDAVYSRVHPDDLPSVKREIEKAIRNCGSLELVHRIVLPDGRIKHLQMRSVFEGANGLAVSGRSTVQDITEVRTAQLALETANEHLEARVEDRTRELASLNRELEAFTYSVSHDLRTPLRSIHGFASLLEEEVETLSPEARTHLRRIQDGARRMGLLITDLLTMAHQSRAVVNAQRLNLSELALAVANDIEREDPQRKVVWHVEPLLWVWADPVLMRVVLQNLLGNAWKYTGQAAQAEISFQRVGQVGRMTEFCVSDNGAGFDMAYVDQLFQPFKRLHAHHEFEGTGVGLASVQRLIQRHGGTVRADGAVGQGAAFYFTLPTEPAGQDPGPESGGEQSPA